MSTRTSKYAAPKTKWVNIQLDRSTFLMLYVTGVLLTIFFSSPWSLLNGFLHGNITFSQLMGWSFLVPLLTPLALIAIAVARGRSNGDPVLFRLPVLAYVVSTVPFLFGLLSRSSTGAASAPSGIPFSMLIPLALIITIVPFVLHIACCIRGSKERRGLLEAEPAADLAKKAAPVTHDYADTIRE